MKLIKTTLFIMCFTAITANFAYAGWYEYPVLTEEQAAELERQDAQELQLAEELRKQAEAEKAIKKNLEQANKKTALSDAEKQAVGLSDKWLTTGVAPYIEGNGKLVYMHGISFPTILASPMQVVDLEFQAGEVINEIVVGDSSRWLIDKGQVGNTTHIFLKPVETNITTNAVITTNKRVYHLRLVSQNDYFTPYVGFAYVNEMKAYERERTATEKRQEQFATINTITASNSGGVVQSENTSVGRVDISDLNFAYSLSTNSYKWKPERIYDDGMQTFIRFPKVSDLPVLLVQNGSQSVLVNYRVVNNTMVIDGVFDKFALLNGVGTKQEAITITAEKR